MVSQRAKIFGIALWATVGGLSLSHGEVLSQQAIALSNSDSPQLAETLTAKKSGGRSGGGSFKSRSRPSNSNSRRSSGSSNYSRPRRHRSNSSSYKGERHYTNTGSHNSSTDANAGLVVFSLMLSVFVIGLLIILISDKLGLNSKGNHGKIDRIYAERDNDRVTVSLL